MIKIRLAGERGYTDLSWLKSFHSFSFGDYHDPRFTNFRSLRVINEDVVSPGHGFGLHPHRDMEIITYVVKGSLAHKDSMGNGSILRAGEVQLMSAGSGVEHSEYNDSKTEPVQFLQIWIIPDSKNLPPQYQQKYFSESDKAGKFCLLASSLPTDGALKIHQDVKLFASIFNPGDKVEYSVDAKRYAWIQVVRGTLEVNTQLLNTGDGAEISAEKNLRLKSDKGAEVLCFDLV